MGWLGKTGVWATWLKGARWSVLGGLGLVREGLSISAGFGEGVAGGEAGGDGIECEGGAVFGESREVFGLGIDAEDLGISNGLFAEVEREDGAEAGVDVLFLCGFELGVELNAIAVAFEEFELGVEVDEGVSDIGGDAVGDEAFLHSELSDESIGGDDAPAGEAALERDIEEERGFHDEGAEILVERLDVVADILFGIYINVH